MEWFYNLDKAGDDNYYMKYVNISNTDSLNLNVNGETEFYVFGEDVCEVGGLVGKNSWSISPWGMLLVVRRCLTKLTK